MINKSGAIVLGTFVAGAACLVALNIITCESSKPTPSPSKELQSISTPSQSVADEDLSRLLTLDESQLLEAVPVKRMIEAAMGTDKYKFDDCMQLVCNRTVDHQYISMDGFVRGLAPDTGAIITIDTHAGCCFVGLKGADPMPVYGAANASEVPPAFVAAVKRAIADGDHPEDTVEPDFQFTPANTAPRTAEDEQNDQPAWLSMKPDPHISNPRLTGTWVRTNPPCTQFDGATLDIKEEAGGNVTFALQGCDGGHTGAAQGQLVMHDDSGTYSQPEEPDAKVEFDRDDKNTLTIEASDYFSGMGVRLSGTYKRVDDAEPSKEAFEL